MIIKEITKFLSKFKPKDSEKTIFIRSLKSSKVEKDNLNGKYFGPKKMSSCKLESKLLEICVKSLGHNKLTNK